MFDTAQRRLTSLHAAIMGNRIKLHPAPLYALPRLGIGKNSEENIKYLSIQNSLDGVHIVDAPCLVRSLYASGYDRAYRHSAAQQHFFNRFFFDNNNSLAFLGVYICQAHLAKPANYSTNLLYHLASKAPQSSDLGVTSYKKLVMSRIRYVQELLRNYEARFPVLTEENALPSVAL